jgi:uncharacterized membrane protein YkoI
MHRDNRNIGRRVAVARGLPVLVLLAAGWWLAAPVQALAQESKAKISKEQASENALQAMPGQVTDITVERKLGKNVYVVEIIADKGGDETDVLVDMDSGKILGIER